MIGWTKLDSKVVFEHPRIKLIEDIVRLPNGEVSQYLLYGGKGYRDFPTIIARRKDGKILVTEEYTYASSQVIFQFPEGAPNPEDKNVSDSAMRELVEETGYIADKLTEIGRCLHEHRRSDCYQHVFLAEGISKTTDNVEKDLEEGEIKLHWFTEKELKKLIKDGKFIQKNALAAWAMYLSR